MRVAAIIAAAGEGSRLGAAVPKPFVDLCGRTVLQRTVDAFDASPRIDEVVIVLPAAYADRPADAIARCRKPMRVTPGGARRQDSVANGFALLDGSVEVVVVHDAARPFVTADLIARTIDAASEAGAAIAAVPSRDTVKRVRRGVVTGTIPRETVALAQTPQAFRADVLRRAIAAGASGAAATDEAALAERAGQAVRLVEGDPANIKITTPEDLEVARRLIGRAADEGLVRIGTGYDLHRLVRGRPLVLGGVTIPHELGLAGHSDADAVAHAVTDAVLGAAGAGDIGRLFPDTDERWAGASSLALLDQAVRVIAAAGYRVENVDVVVIAERPKLAPHVDEMKRALATALRVDASMVSIKGKTSEGVGEIGRGEAIAVHAVALVRRTSRS